METFKTEVDQAVAKWDERYGRGEHATREPSQLLIRALDFFAREVPRRGGAQPRALDIACGAGRHALLLAMRGFAVTAVDKSRVGIEIARDRARELDLRIEMRVADLERGEFYFEPEAYDVVCNFYYLQRDLFPSMRATLRPGGLFVAAIHLKDHGPDVKPMNPAFLLEPGELRAKFEDWEILHYHETSCPDADAGDHQRRSAELIARKTVQAKHVAQAGRAATRWRGDDTVGC